MSVILTNIYNKHPHTKHKENWVEEVRLLYPIIKNFTNFLNTFVMYQITKETLIGTKVINEETIGYVTDYEAPIIANSIKGLVKIANYKHELLGDSHRVRFIIDKLNNSVRSVIDYIHENITEDVHTVNNYIKCANHIATKSAQRFNKDKVNLIKEVKVDDYLYFVSTEGVDNRDIIVIQ